MNDIELEIDLELVTRLYGKAAKDRDELRGRLEAVELRAETERKALRAKHDAVRRERFELRQEVEAMSGALDRFHRDEIEERDLWAHAGPVKLFWLALVKRRMARKALGL